MKWLMLAGGVVSLVGAGLSNRMDAAALGAPLPGLTEVEASNFRVGRDIFRRTWQPHTEFYNARSCFQCHRDPALGGTSSSSFDFAFFMREPKDPTGWKPFPWLIWRGRPAGQRLPFGEFESRRPGHLFGLGLLDAVPTDAILARADPRDMNRDGISGRLIKLEGGFGRFGWRGSAPSLDAFVRGAFENEMGLRLDGGLADNRLSSEMIALTADSVRFLAPPSPRPLGDQGKGRLVFDKGGCGSCHTPEWTTGDSPHAALARKKITPYTDMLMHDLGRGKGELDTGDQLSVREFRTPALWGLGLSDGPFFHDGSTATLEEAIERHEGEALRTRDTWRKLPRTDKDALLRFLKSL